MLNALKKQLLQLSNEKERLFLGALKKRVGSRQAMIDAGPLRNFILVMPEMIAQLRAWSEDENIPRHVRSLQGHLLTYLYHPVDFLHDKGYGLFGYLDDAYFVGCIYQASQNCAKDKQLKYLANHQDLSHQIPDWIATVRRVLPKETAQIHKLITELSGGNIKSLEKMLGMPDRFMNGKRERL